LLICRHLGRRNWPQKVLASRKFFQMSSMKRKAEEITEAETTAVPVWKDDMTIEFVPHGKKAGTKSFDRYEEYSKAKTVAEALKLGAKRCDLTWDFQKKLLKLVGTVFLEELESPEKVRKPATPCTAKSVPGCPISVVKQPAVAKTLTDGVKLSGGMVLPVVGFGTYKMKRVRLLALCCRPLKQATA